MIRSATKPRGRRASEHAVSTDAGVSRGEGVLRAYEQLRELIVWGRLAPGTRIVETEIAARLGVSRTPARSALHRLRQEGYVVGSDRLKEQRLIVAPLTQGDARELFHVVGQLEGLAARNAAEQPRAMRTELVRRLGQLNLDLSETGHRARANPMQLFDLDTAFHQAYVDAGAGPRLLALHSAVKPQAERYIRLYTSLVDEISASVEEHAVIVRCLDGGEPLAAEQAVATNWRNAATRLARVIATLGERGSW